MQDFTLIKYRELLETLKKKNYAFARFYDYAALDSSVFELLQNDRRFIVNHSTLPTGRHVNQSSKLASGIRYQASRIQRSDISR